MVIDGYIYDFYFYVTVSIFYVHRHDITCIERHGKQTGNQTITELKARPRALRCTRLLRPYGADIEQQEVAARFGSARGKITDSFVYFGGMALLTYWSGRRVQDRQYCTTNGYSSCKIQSRNNIRLGMYYTVSILLESWNRKLKTTISGQAN